MVNIITGSRDSGKSSHFLRLYKEAGSKDIGVFSLKLFDAGGGTTGYDLCLLPEGEQLPLARLSSDASVFTDTDCLYQGRFVFSRSAFEYATSYILKRLATSSIVWIDEVGKLEIEGLGYSSLLQQLLKQQTDLTLTIRDRYLPSFLAMYGLPSLVYKTIFVEAKL